MTTDDVAGSADAVSDVVADAVSDVVADAVSDVVADAVAAGLAVARISRILSRG